MDLPELGDMGSGCQEDNCSLAAGLYLEDCSSQDCQQDEHIFGLIELVCVTVVYVPLMLLGLVGNILTILVVWLRPHMRSSTYLYLSSMAVSDLLILLLLPLDLYKIWRPRPWPLGDLACKLTMFLSECCTFCTILHITFLSLERYLAVCWPITAKTLVTRHRTRVLIGCLWLGAAVSAAPVLVMVGVEEVGGEELGLSGWREDGGWADMDGEQGGFAMGGEGGGTGYRTFTDGALDGIKWDEDTGLGGERKLGIIGIKEDSREINNEKPGETKDEMDDDGQQQSKMREDEGGGREDHQKDTDNSECRCTHYAISSGLLSAMMVVSNLYFLVPVCVLGLVYSLIGRTLWLRPQRDSRRDKSHRHTVKMLGVIVLAFVLCWLPFHVGRTIFTLSLGTGADGHEAALDTDWYTDAHPDDIHGDTHNTTHTNPAAPGVNVGGSAPENMAHDDQERDDASCDKRSSVTRTGRHPRLTTHTRRRRAGGNTHMNTHADAKLINTQGSTYGGNNQTTSNNTVCGRTRPHMNTPTCFHGNTHISIPTYTEAHTLAVTHDDTAICTNTNSQHTPPSAAPMGVHGYTHSNHTHTPADTHLYFLYYLSQYFNLVSSVFFYLSAAVNPLLYNLMSARYRRAVHSLFHTHVHTQARHLRTFTTHHSTTHHSTTTL